MCPREGIIGKGLGRKFQNLLFKELESCLALNMFCFVCEGEGLKNHFEGWCGKDTILVVSPINISLHVTHKILDSREGRITLSILFLLQ